MNQVEDELRTLIRSSANRAEVARQAGISYPALRNFLAGADVKTSTLRRLAGAVGLELLLAKR